MKLLNKNLYFFKFFKLDKWLRILIFSFIGFISASIISNSIDLFFSNNELIFIDNQDRSTNNSSKWDQLTNNKNIVVSEQPKKSYIFDSLNVVIKGILGNIAVVDTKQKRNNILLVGDILINDVKLVDIKGKTLIFDESGKKFTVVMKENLLSGIKINNQSNNDINNIDFLDNNDLMLGKQKNISQLKGINYSISENKIAENIFQEVKKKPSDIFKYINAKPLFSNGKLNGIKISILSQSKTFEQLGLVTGDIIKSIDGKAISDIQSNFNLQSLFKKKRVMLTLDRGGNKLNIILNN